MGREPSTIDYFKLTINRLTPEQLGVVIADLAKRDIVDITPELITDVATFKTKAANGEIIELLTAWTAEHPTFAAIEAVRYFESIGRQGTSVYNVLGKLVEAGVLAKSGPGMYRRADVKQLAGPKPEKKPHAKPNRDAFEINHREFILRYARKNHGRFSVTKLRELFAANKRKPASIGGAVDMLKQRKLIKPMGDGEYVLLKAAAKPAPKKKPPANGAADHIETPAAAEA